MITPRQFAEKTDYTLLAPTAIGENIRELCHQALEYNFYSICVNPRWVSFAADQLDNSQVKVCTVIGFPLGADLLKTKQTAAQAAIMQGADELDLVCDLAAIKEKNGSFLLKEISAILHICRNMKPPVTLKLIIESAALSDSEKEFICSLANSAGVDFLKTSTGTHKAGNATVEDVKLIKQLAPNCQVKASGGIKTAQHAIDLINAGADRIGTSSAVSIFQELQS